MREFQNALKKKMDEYVHEVYKLTRSFPKQEIYVSVSQWRRAALSIILNYIEGYARRRILVRLNFLEIAYGSLRECKYLQHFSCKEGFISDEAYKQLHDISEEIGAMLWTEIGKLEQTVPK